MKMWTCWGHTLPSNGLTAQLWVTSQTPALTPPGSYATGLVLPSDSAWQGSQHPAVSDTGGSQGLVQGHLYSTLGPGAQEYN